jgi:capsular exopolysaccharide synthesis family protein
LNLNALAKEMPVMSSRASIPVIATNGLDDASWQEPPSAMDALHDILNILRRYCYFIATFVLLCTLITAFVTVHLKPLYRVELNILVDPHTAQVNDVQTLLATQPNFFDASFVRSQTAILTSEDLIRQVVIGLDLEDSPDFQAGSSRLFTGLSLDGAFDRYLFVAGDAVARTVGAAASALGIAASPTPPALKTRTAKIDVAIARYLERLSLVNDGRSYVVTLHFSATDPALAVKIVNAHARAYLAREVATKIASVKEANSSVNAELDTLAAKLHASEEALRVFRNTADMVGPGDPAMITQQIGDLTGKLIAVQSQMIEKQARVRELQTLGDDPGGRDTGTVLAPSAYDRLRSKELDLQQQEAELRATYGDAYPKVAEIRPRIAATEAQLKIELARMVKSATADVGAVRSQQDQLISALQSAKVNMQRQESGGSRLHVLEAEVEANKAVYTSFLTRLRQLTAQETLQQPDGRVIGEAIPPTHAYFPRPALFIAGGFFGSTAFALLFALLLGYTSRTFNSIEDVERECDVSGLGIVPLVRRRLRRSHPHNQVPRAPSSHYAERVRLIRNSLTLGLEPQRQGQVILIASSLPGEGKSSCAISLAMSVAATGRKTLLIDADLRKPAVGRLLGADPARRGFGDLIEAKASFEDIVQIHSHTGLQYVAADHATQTAKDRIDLGVTQEFFEGIRGRYDYIFVDSSPLIAVSDALWLARLADATVFLVRWRSTPRSAVRAALRKLRDTGTQVTGVLLTFVDVRKSGSLSPNDFDYYLRHVSKYYAHR